jgi:hypothetical protein
MLRSGLANSPPARGLATPAVESDGRRLRVLSSPPPRWGWSPDFRSILSTPRSGTEPIRPPRWDGNPSFRCRVAPQRPLLHLRAYRPEPTNRAFRTTDEDASASCLRRDLLVLLSG